MINNIDFYLDVVGVVNTRKITIKSVFRFAKVDENKVANVHVSNLQIDNDAVINVCHKR